MRLFFALAAATLCGALATGLYAVAVDAASIGFVARLWKVTPKALVLAGLLLPVAALAAAFVGQRLARPIEDLTEAATRIAEGHRATKLPRGGGDEMHRLARALVSMRRELEGKPYAAAFLRDAWHDLKTPVAALRATLEVLDDEALEDRAATRHFVANLRRSTDQLERTLADLVTLARFETASLSPEESTPLHDLMNAALERISPLAEATEVKVRTQLDAEGELRCDPAAIGRAIGNVLENAVTATPGGEVEISATGDRSTIVVDVTNEPAFVPPQARKRLFERAPTSRDGRGTGLGLAMARAAVEAHGGTIRFLEMGPPRVRVRLELPR
ncbi:MAG: HAMP domain-containing sensor histidine kinase [Polyangiales bacterium]